MDAFFNLCKIKYAILDSYIGKFTKTNNIKTCNIFINLDYINYRFRTVSNNTQFQACGAAAFKQYASNVLNLAAHYKKWFNRNNINVKCYIYYTNAAGGFTSALIKRDYRRDYILKQDINNPDCYYVNHTINGGTQLLTSVCDYIDGVYLINTKGEEPSVTPYLIAKERPADWNYILTMDRLELQYVNYDKFSILYPSVKFGARVVNAADIWQIIGEKENKATEHLTQYDPRLFIPVMAIAGDKVRSIKKIRTIGWISILDTLEEIWNMDKDHSIVTAYEHLENLLKTKNRSLEEKYLNTYRMNTMILSQIKDIPDKETINEISINPMIFGNYPINVEALFGRGLGYIDWSKK